jgi:hypothetical protein
MGEECSTEVGNANKMLVRKPEGAQSHGKIYIDVRIILKWILMEYRMVQTEINWLFVWAVCAVLSKM